MNATTRYRAMLLASALALSSCEADGEEPDLPPALQIGTGEVQFEPLTAGQRVQLVAGTQGGYHVWLSLRAQGFEGERLRMQLELASEGPAPLARSDLEVPFERAAAQRTGEWVEYVGWPAQLLEPWCAVERNLTVRVTVSDRQGHTASGTAMLVPTAPVRGFAVSCDK